MASNVVETKEKVERSLTPTPATSEQSRSRYYKRVFQGDLVGLMNAKSRKGLYETAYDNVRAKIESEAISLQVHSDKRHQFELFKKSHKDDKETLGYLQQLDKEKKECPQNEYTSNTAGIGIEDKDQQRLWDVASYIRNENPVDELNQGPTAHLYRIQARLQYLACFDINVWNVADPKKTKCSEPLPINRSSSKFFSSSVGSLGSLSVGPLGSFFSSSCSAPEEKPSSNSLERRELTFQKRKES